MSTAAVARLTAFACCLQLLHGSYEQQVKLTASDNDNDDLFGTQARLSEDFALIGANGDDAGGAEAGAAYVFVRNGSAWTQQAKLTADDAAAGDRFGDVGIISQDSVAVGAHYENNQRGAVYIFERSGTTWSQNAKLTASDASDNDYFGQNVDVSGDYLVAAAGGASYVFKWSGSAWSEQQKLEVSGIGSRFARSVQFDGDAWLLLGCPFTEDDPGEFAGAAYIFTRSGTTWTNAAKLRGNDTDVGDRFGYVSMSGDYLVVGAPQEDSAGNNAGAVYVYTGSGSSWTQHQKLTASDAEADAHFGRTVSMSGDLFAVGAEGATAWAVYLFGRSGSTWSQQEKLTATSVVSVPDLSWSGDVLLVGIKKDDTSAGAAYVFEAVTDAPTDAPTVTAAPTVTPTQWHVPSSAPSLSPTQDPTDAPSFAPSLSPTEHPTHSPTTGPTDAPTAAPTADPTTTPTTAAPDIAKCHSDDHDDDCQALVGLYEATNRELGATGWANGTSYCGWPGVTCNARTGRVTQVWIEYNNITGSVPDSLAGLSWLKTLYIDNNYLSGTLPPGLGDLEHLKTIYVSNNSVAGTIPAEWGTLTTLETLYLCNNNLTGTIPQSLFEGNNMEKLRYLGLASNLISGSVPSTLANLDHLQQLWLQDNRMTVWNSTEICDLFNRGTMWDYELQANPFVCPIPSCADLAHATCGIDSFEWK